MNQAFDAGLELDEGAKLGDSRDCSAYTLAGLILFGHQVPGIGLQLLHAERNAATALATAVLDLEDLHLDLVAWLQQVRRLVDAAPGHVGDVQQAIDAADIHKRAEVGERAHSALDDGAFLQVRQPLLPVAGFFLFKDCAAVHDYVFIGHIQLDDLAGDFLTDQFFQFGGVFGPTARGGQERAHTDIHAQPTLDGARYHAGHGALFLERFFERAPILRPRDLDL